MKRLTIQTELAQKKNIFHSGFILIPIHFFFQMTFLFGFVLNPFTSHHYLFISFHISLKHHFIIIIFINLATSSPCVKCMYICTVHVYALRAKSFCAYKIIWLSLFLIPWKIWQIDNQLKQILRKYFAHELPFVCLPTDATIASEVTNHTVPNQNTIKPREKI